MTPALKLNGTKLDNRVHQVAIGNTWTLSSTSSTNSGSASTTSSTPSGASWRSCATWSRSWAFPASRRIPPEAWGIPNIGITGFSGFGDNTEGPYTNRNKAFEFIDNLSWIRGRHSFKVGGGIRYDMYNQVGNQFARGKFQFQNIATGYGFADFLLGYMQQSESAVALAVTQFRALSQSLLLHRHLEGPRRT